jgi:hypothetical protein
MASYRILTRVTAIEGSGRYLCVVVALPEPPDDENVPSESETRVLASEQLARESCRDMAQAMAERIRARGDRVTKQDP